MIKSYLINFNFFAKSSTIVKDFNINSSNSYTIVKVILLKQSLSNIFILIAK